ncbi:hypothetical protein [Streptomyces sp. NPDC053367]|uniref:hypothetical protein n=1 Tax=Streptomyces sp. NPDC053367 TaxID=3365700 RepID=UPI0037CEBC08
MSHRPLRAALGLAAAGALSLSLAAVPAQAAPAADPFPFAWTQLVSTYTATGAYGYEPFTQAGGYLITPCVPGLGYRYVDLDAVQDDGDLDPGKPEALLYEDGPDGRRRLVGAEWIVQAGTGVDRPSLFGQDFNGPDLLPQPLGSGHTLRAWLYKTNPDGLFSPTNPTVTCPANPAP